MYRQSFFLVYDLFTVREEQSSKTTDPVCSAGVTGRAVLFSNLRSGTLHASLLYDRN